MKPPQCLQWERDVAESIERLAGLMRDSVLSKPSSHFQSIDSIVRIAGDHFQGHSGDLEASLFRAFKDFDHYRGLGRVPLLNSDDASLPVSIRTVKRRLDASGFLEHEETYTHSSALRAAIDKWADLDDAYAVGTVEEAAESFHDNLETFMTNRFGGLRMWESAEVPERIPHGRVMNDAKTEGPTSSNIGTGLFRVTVKCKAPGYRILVSPAYFIDWVYFGAPSTPVTNGMLPGRYIFGTDSVDGSVISDGVIFRIPNDFTPNLERF